jgi:hypothetical protein
VKRAPKKSAAEDGKKLKMWQFLDGLNQPFRNR